MLSSRHNISINDIPDKDFKEFNDDISLTDEGMRIKYIVERALSYGYGKEQSIGHFEREELENLNELISSEKINYKFKDSDFL